MSPSLTLSLFLPRTLPNPTWHPVLHSKAEELSAEMQKPLPTTVLFCLPWHPLPEFLAKAKHPIVVRDRLKKHQGYIIMILIIRTDLFDIWKTSEWGKKTHPYIFMRLLSGWNTGGQNENISHVIKCMRGERGRRLGRILVALPQVMGFNIKNHARCWFTKTFEQFISSFLPVQSNCHHIFKFDLFIETATKKNLLYLGLVWRKETKRVIVKFERGNRSNRN